MRCGFTPLIRDVQPFLTFRLRAQSARHMWRNSDPAPLYLTNGVRQSQRRSSNDSSPSELFMPKRQSRPPRQGFWNHVTKSLSQKITSRLTRNPFVFFHPRDVFRSRMTH
jgi:hypothetical protein